MRQVPLREFRIRGEQALASVPKGEVVLLTGQKGSAYYLVRVQGDVALGDKELRRAMAIASLQESWRYAEQQSLDHVSDDEIHKEIRRMRQRKPKLRSSR